MEVNTRKPSLSNFLRYFVSSSTTKLCSIGFPLDGFIVAPLKRLNRKLVR
jgi:hypothetical protein